MKKARGQLSGEGGREGSVEDTRRVSGCLKEYGSQFYITSPRANRRGFIHEGWSGIEDKLEKVSSQNRAKRKFLIERATTMDRRWSWTDRAEC